MEKYQNFYHCAGFPGESGQWIMRRTMATWGQDTLGHIDERMESFHIPNLAKNGNCKPASPLIHAEPAEKPLAYYTELNEAQYRQGHDDRTLGR